MIVILSGGTGTPKLLQGLVEVIDKNKINVIVNTAEDKWLSFGYLSPDIDTVLYTLAGIINEDTWYGIKNDTFRTHEMLSNLGSKEALMIGDLDRGVKIQKGELLKAGKRMSEAVEFQRSKIHIKSKIFPMSDDHVKTVIKTRKKEMDFHEFLVENKGKPEILDIFFNGIEKARGCKKALNAIKKADGIIIGPSNPITSIQPIISIKEIKDAIIKKRKRCVAVSPVVMGMPIGGPTTKFMTAKGLNPDSYTIASLYKSLISSFIIDNSEGKMTKKKIEDLGIDVFKTNIVMRGLEDKIKLARVALKVLNLE